MSVFLVIASVHAETLRIAVASNFRPAAAELAQQFTQQSGIDVVLVAASTGVLATQLRAGAPFDVFLAADAARVQTLVDAGLALGPIRCYARGSLVLLGADKLEPALAGNQSIAIANPRSAPYGEAALAVLARDGFRGPKARRVVMGSNVQQALQFYQSGAAPLALIARSLSPASGLPIPPGWHPPIEQYLLISAKTPQPAAAARFTDYLLSADVAARLPDLGYLPCS